ncbi:hypothetical protein CLAIMM_14313 [Cladophialophora immunda]|nr:hypothetical protein CLAIMM_14313 [Cladophialophora immunda]
MGRETALELARRGADVVVNYANSSKAADELVAEIKALGRDSITVQANVSDVSQIINMENMALNVSVVQEDAISERDIARWQRIFGYSKPGAVRRIEEYRSDYSKTRITGSSGLSGALWRFRRSQTARRE